jgi:hypothetical protein
VLAAYEHAVERAGYRFFSYGDAMLVFPARWNESENVNVVNAGCIALNLLTTDGGARGAGA